MAGRCWSAAVRTRTLSSLQAQRRRAPLLRECRCPRGHPSPPALCVNCFSPYIFISKVTDESYLKITSSWSPGSFIYTGSDAVDIWLGVLLARCFIVSILCSVTYFCEWGWTGCMRSCVSNIWCRCRARGPGTAPAVDDCQAMDHSYNSVLAPIERRRSLSFCFSSSSSSSSLNVGRCESSATYSEETRHDGLIK